MTLALLLISSYFIQLDRFNGEIIVAYPLWGNIHCLGTENCTIDCTTNDCMYANMYCPPDYDCNVICHGCYETNVYCPPNALCNIKCDYNCGNMMVHWSADPTNSKLSCNNYACHGVSYPTQPPDQPFILICNATLLSNFSCRKIVINCPSNATCDIICDGKYSCQETVINWPITPGLGSLTCIGEGACHKVNFPIPNPNQAYTVTCDDVSECDSATIYCPTDADCTIQCTDASACRSAIVTWPTNSSVANNLTCIGTNACHFVSPPINPINDDTDLYVYCDEYNECWNLNINCPQNAGCYVECTAAQACLGIKVNWVANQPHSLLCGLYRLSCTGQIIHPIDENADLVLNCYREAPCASNTINCPMYGSCSIICGSTYGSCASMIVNCADNQQCDVACNSEGSCATMTFNWPKNHSYTLYCAQQLRSCQMIHFNPYQQNAAFDMNCSAQEMCANSTFYCPANGDCTILCDDLLSCKEAIFVGAINQILRASTLK